MSAEALALVALGAALTGHVIHALVLAMHCRRDSREFRRLRERPEDAR
jgi:uncharacterized integral membrane protein